EDAISRSPEGAVKDLLELDPRSEIDGHLGAARHGSGQALGLGLKDPGQASIVLDEVVASVRLLRDGREDLLVVIDVDADGAHRDPSRQGPLSNGSEAGYVADAVIGVAIAEQNHPIDLARRLLEEGHALLNPAGDAGVAAEGDRSDAGVHSLAIRRGDRGGG